MASEIQFGFFPSKCAGDNAVMRRLAKRLRQCWLRGWIDEYFREVDDVLRQRPTH
jgi:hypothetical protein